MAGKRVDLTLQSGPKREWKDFLHSMGPIGDDLLPSWLYPEHPIPDCKTPWILHTILC